MAAQPEPPGAAVPAERRKASRVNAHVNPGAVADASRATEQAVLGALLFDSDIAAPLVEGTGLAALHMSTDPHAYIFGAIARVTARGERADAVSVYEELQKLGQHDKAGGLVYLNQLALQPQHAANAGQQAAAVLRAYRRRRVATLGTALARNPDAPDIGAELLAELQAAEVQHGGAEHFRNVDVAALAEHVPPAPEYWWHAYLPAGLVSLLGAHGGTGKSMVALMLCVCIALGRTLFGVATKPGIAVFYSGEDGADMLAYRLHWICECMGVSPVELQGRLHILDATESDPVLYREAQDGGRRSASTTTAYDALRRRLDEVQADVLVIDNMSDTYDGNEIARAPVGAYFRALGMLAKPRRAVLVLAHVDKGTARGDRPGGTQGYSGSTAAHNKVRSRMFMYRDKDDTLVLEHQKNNLGRMREPLRLVWPDGRLPGLQAPDTPALQHLTDAADMKALLRLLHEFYGRGEYVAPAPTSTSNAPRMLAGQRDYPARRKPAEVFELLRSAERQHYIERQDYLDAWRKSRQRWALTYGGCTLIGGSAVTAATAVTHQDDAGTADGGGVAATAAPSAARGVGRERPHKPSAGYAVQGAA